jgi:aryl-alcohol dehydrogenase-like predicted oxidoreductase
VRSVRIEGTSLQTSRLGLGTASLHHLFSSRARQRLLERAWSCGVRYFDTAPLYGHEMAERELGRFVRARRGDSIVTTKFGLLPNALLSAVPAAMYAQKAAARVLRRPVAARPARDYSARHARERVDRSLRMLATDYIDILYLHEPALALLPDPLELIDTLADLRRAGKIRHVGISGTIESCREIAARHPALGEICQVDVHVSPVATATSPGGRGVQVTFGHFRAMAAGATAGQRERVERCLVKAVETNPTGVILFSTRKLDHVDQIAAILATVDSG